ncbi:hypothetical protein QC762_103385 [Podospora pseudocomata]|uniref:Uncharacterized protein n=1 Tax=Podospora pseudocomata TaxID=2093779 RepID=A0ABR0GSM7_9PEZI|nr:hypothetical protein QC762_103385 [Podospora pseudocomata]
MAPPSQDHNLNTFQPHPGNSLEVKSMERDRNIREASLSENFPPYEAVPVYQNSIPLESRSPHPFYHVDLESNNHPVETNNNPTATRRTLTVRVFAPRTETVEEEEERKMRAMGLMLAFLTILGITLAVATIVGIYILQG